MRCAHACRKRCAQTRLTPERLSTPLEQLAFIDAHSFDLRAVKKSCVHIAQPDGKLIPFDTFNLFYRDGRAEILEKLRAELLPGEIAHVHAE